MTESANGTPEDVVPGTGHWSTFGLDGRMQPDNWHYRTASPPADEAKVRESHRQPDNHLGCGFPVKFKFPPLPGKPSSVCLATEFV